MPVGVVLAQKYAILMKNLERFAIPMNRSDPPISDPLPSFIFRRSHEVNDIKDNLMTTIRELKQICTHFNFPEEMAGTIEKLRKEVKIVPDMYSKEESNNTADDVDQLLKHIQ